MRYIRVRHGEPLNINTGNPRRRKAVLHCEGMEYPLTVQRGVVVIDRETARRIPRPTGLLASTDCTLVHGGGTWIVSFVNDPTHSTEA